MQIYKYILERYTKAKFFEYLDKYGNQCSLGIQ